jgi:hypothetical protein
MKKTARRKRIETAMKRTGQIGESLERAIFAELLALYAILDADDCACEYGGGPPGSCARCVAERKYWEGGV